jgi:hypothetical protein
VNTRFRRARTTTFSPFTIIMSEVSRGRILPKRRSRSERRTRGTTRLWNLSGTATTTPPTIPVDRGLRVDSNLCGKKPSEPRASVRFPSDRSHSTCAVTIKRVVATFFVDDVGHLPARRRCRERNLYTLCCGKRAAGESSALPRRHLASSPFTLHEHGRGRLGQLLRQPRLRVADVRVRRRLRGLRPAHAALAPAATGLQPTAPHRVNTSGTHGTPCPLHQHCRSHRNAS